MNKTDTANAVRFLEREARRYDGDFRRMLKDTAQYLGEKALFGMPTGIEAEVCEMIAKRQQLGIAKYGMTVADNPLALHDWLQHALEETLDQAVYLKRAISELNAAPHFRVAVANYRTGSLWLNDSLTDETDEGYRVDEGDHVVVLKVNP